MSKIFISYSHSDRKIARKFAKDLRAAGHIVWIDEGEIQIGDSLIEKIRDGLDEVDYVAALISKDSVGSNWVKRELDIASNKEIKNDQVFVLPILLDEVELPGFLEGKFYGNLVEEKNYDNVLEQILKRLKPESKVNLSKEEYDNLHSDLEFAKKMLEFHQNETNRRTKLLNHKRSKELLDEIEKDNERHPEFAHINNHYAFDAGRTAITLGYALHCIAKAKYRGGHVLEALLTMTDTWDKFEAMIEAFNDYISTVEE